MQKDTSGSRGQVLINWLLVLVWAAFIFHLSNQPNLRISPDPLWDLFLRKGAHIFVFGTLWFLIYRALRFKLIALAILFTILYAISDEYHQRFIYMRHADPKDVLIDCVGITIAVVLYYFSKKYHEMSGRNIL